MHNVHGLEGDALQGGTGNVRRRGAAGDAADDPVRILVPVRGAHAGEGWHKVHAAIVRHRSSQGLHLRRGADYAQAVPQPLHHGTAHKDGTFQRIRDRVPYLPGHRSEQVVLGQDGLGARIHEQEAARSVGILHRARLRAHLAEEGRLLVSGDTRNGHLMRKDGGFGVAIHLRRGLHGRHHGTRNAQHGQEFVVPLQSIDIEQHGAGSVGDVRHMHRSARKLPHQPAIHRAKTQLPCLGLLTGARHIVQYPFYLGP